ncbi:MAG: hypothetical protein L0Y56_22385, partial [Nitrospira sp.]|nr:hypothetical protein [Nitrospira sp.]
MVKFFYDRDWSGTEKELRRAIELNPNSAMAHFWHIPYFKAMGRRDESIAASKRTLELDPLSLYAGAEFCWSFYYARQYDQGIEQARKTLEMDPSFPFARFCLACNYGVGKKLYEESISEFQKLLDLTRRDSYMLGSLGWIYGLSGNKVEARKIVDELKERAKQEYVDPAAFMYTYLGLDEREQVFEWMQKAYE